MSTKSELILENAKDKFASARELCPGMPAEMYLLTDYISEVTNDSIVPTGLCNIIALITYDLQRGKNGFKSDELFPKNVMSNANKIISQMTYLPQVVDTIASEEFANEFRVLCNELFGFNPTRRINVKSEASYPDYVKAAVDWWIGAIQSPKFDNGDEFISILATALASARPTLTEEQIRKFKDTLAAQILTEMKTHGKCTLSVDYHPCDSLYEARRAMGLDNVDLFPFKTNMTITDSLVEVSEGYGAPMEVIWTNEKTKDQEEPQAQGMKHK